MRSALAPFASTAAELARHGLTPIPVGGEDGKKPLVKWPRRRLAPDSPAIKQWKENFADANVGILTKPSNVAVIDVDDPGLLPIMEERFGVTPLITRTPSGGGHLWYQAQGESSRNLRRSEGLPVDVKAGGAGQGGFVVVPPSIRPSGPHAGRPYRFERGSWDDLTRLPTMRAGSLPSLQSKERSKGSVGEPFSVDANARATGVGSRNDTLFRFLLRNANRCADFDALLGVAIEHNSTFDSPLPETEVVRTAKSAWQYRECDRIWSKGAGRVAISAAEIAALGGHGDALLLLAFLRLQHGARNGPFAVAIRAMSDADVIPGWGRARYRSARNALLSAGPLKMLHRGGDGPNDRSIFCFPRVRQLDTI